jgi:hypothetical protein
VRGHSDATDDDEVDLVAIQRRYERAQVEVAHRRFAAPSIAAACLHRR